MNSVLDSWSALEAIYMERIAEIEAARDALWERASRYQAALAEQQLLVNHLQARIKDLER
jgi:hypothetical protein